MTTPEKKYQMPAEWEPHEGTWIFWPHKHTQPGHELRLEGIWLHIAQALQGRENLHIVAYDEAHRDHIMMQLNYFGIALTGVSFYTMPTNDVWARDTGPIFVYDEEKNLVLTDWVFNGWGKRFKYGLDDQVAKSIGKTLDLPTHRLSMVLEGGSVEINGAGTFMGTRSSIMNTNRNPAWPQEKVEKILSEYLGVSHFIWLTGAGNEAADKLGGVTDTHIDGTARFTSESIVLYSWAEDESDPRHAVYANCYEELQEVVLPTGKKLDLVALPIPKNGVHNMTSLKWLKTTVTPASYCNFYIANDVVLVPSFGNVNDAQAKEIIGEQFPNREVIGINVLNLIELGGALHCVTQQQPMKKGK
ncbi:MAG: agmatine deiminase family protein [Anaerolineae bacterium]|jgi:agmatine deiminase|nr:agmatine deiminase family protein [Anaerolineae bacterium]